MQIGAYLFPELVVGSLPIVSMTIQAKGTLGISRLNAIANMILNVSLHAFPPKFSLECI